jgi:hypothetical protein
LCIMKLSVQTSHSSFSAVRNEVLCLNSRIGHQRLTHGHLLRPDPEISRNACGTPLTVSQHW